MLLDDSKSNFFPLSCSSTSKGGAQRFGPGLINIPRVYRAKPVWKTLGSHYALVSFIKAKRELPEQRLAR